MTTTTGQTPDTTPRPNRRGSTERLTDAIILARLVLQRGTYDDHDVRCVVDRILTRDHSAAEGSGNG